VYSCKEYGKANERSILFIHGGGVSGWMWKKQVDFFGGICHCLVVDLPDHGESRSIPFTSVPDAANELLQLVHSRGHGKKAVVVGHSLGAKIALFMLSLDDIGAVERCVAASAYFGRTTRAEKALAVMMMNLNRSGICSRIQGRSMGFRDPDMERSHREESRKMTSGAIRRFVDAFARTDEIPRVPPSSRAPVLVLAGSAEGRNMLESGKRIMAVIPRAQGFILEGCGHLYPIQAADRFNETVAYWIDGSLAASAR
jgi:pimeloyl-ACP methyl ester carboxylesterase